MTKSNFRRLSSTFWFWLRMAGCWCTSKLQSYILVSAYPLSAVFGVMYLLIRAAMLPSAFKLRVFMGCYDSAREEMPNFRVEERRFLALNLPWDGCSSTESSNLEVLLPNILFLYYYSISFRWFLSFLTRLSYGSSRPRLLAHFFYRPCSLLISISCRLFFLRRTSNSFFIFIISLFSSYFNFIYNYRLSFSCFLLKLALCCSACSCINLSTRSFSLTSNSLSYFRKSRASYTRYSKETNFSWNCSSFSLFFGLILRYYEGCPSLFSNYCDS